MPLVLVSAAGDRRFSITGTATLMVGRDPVSDLPILDPAVSRRHAEVRLDERTPRVHVTDLGSRNGTWINGTRITRATAKAGDTVAFGTVVFNVLEARDAAQRPTPSTPPLDSGATLLRERVVPSREQALADVAAARDAAPKRLAQLVSIAQRLGTFTDLDPLLEAIAHDLFVSFNADRVAILLAGADGTLETRISRDRTGAIPRPVPRAIASGVAERQVALLTNDAARDERTVGESVIQQSVSSAMAAPLIGEERRTLGILYVDHLAEHREFDDGDLAFLVAFAGIASAAVEREQQTEKLQQAARVRENFERYFTPQLAERIAGGQQSVQPGGVRQRVVVMFTDVRGFTKVAESLPPTQMAQQLNEYFARMVDCVFRHEGALDKFIGDAVMAYWGVPEPGATDAQLALLAAFDMQRELAQLNARWRREGRPELLVGIGIHAGDAFVGNIGSPRRLEFTLIGDTVNVANRLCGLAAGGQVLGSDALCEALPAMEPRLLRADLQVRRNSGEDARVWQLTGVPV
ncbi:MAG: FHA domain-containing protein [Gemmatimonadaceae bacterium]|nr:FHA domain-containing protein [Gemmatimonadaceae bacterium]